MISRDRSDAPVDRPACTWIHRDKSETNDMIISTKNALLLKRSKGVKEDTQFSNMSKVERSGTERWREMKTST